MANIENVKNIKSLQSWDVPVTIHRTDAQPLDNASYFTHISAAENYALSGATSYVGQELFVVNTTLSTADAYVIQDISGSLKKLATTIDVQQLSSDLSGEIGSLSTSLSNDIKQLLSDLSGEIDNLSTDLSNAISSKIFVGEQTSSVTGDFTDLSVIKISRADYEQAVVDAASNGVDLSNNVLYVISSDYIDAYERQIKNVVMEDDNTPSDAVNKHFVEQLSDRISQTIDNNIDAICTVISNDISGYISSINDTIDNKLCVAISNNADDISTKIWIENKIDQTKSPGFSDLSIIKLSDTEYEQLLIDAYFGTVDINEKTLYVISANNMNAYGQRIENLTMTDDTTPSEAATKHYVDNYAEESTENALSIHNILSAFDNSKYVANQTLSGGLNLNSDLSVVLSALIEVWKMFGGKTV